MTRTRIGWIAVSITNNYHPTMYLSHPHDHNSVFKINKNEQLAFTVLSSEGCGTHVFILCPIVVQKVGKWALKTTGWLTPQVN